MMLPVTAVTALLGTHVWVYRLVPTLFYVALLCVWWSVGRQLVATKLEYLGGAAAVLGVLSLDTANVSYDGRFGSGTVIGESTSTLGVLLAIVLARRPTWAGLCLGLAVMTKVIVLLALPGVLVAVALHARRQGRLMRALSLFLVGLGTPLLLWQSARILSVGWSDALAANRDFLDFMGTAGSQQPIGRVTDQFVTMGASGVGAVIVMAVVVLISTVRNKALPIRREQVPMMLGILLAGAALELYWLLFESQRAVRHSTQAAQLLSPLILAIGIRAAGELRLPALRHGFTAAAGSLLILQVGIAAHTAWFPFGPSLDDQRRAAEIVARRSSTFHFVDTAIVPDLTLLRPELTARPLGSQGGLLVLSGMSGPPSTDPCDRILDEYANYVICDVDAGGPYRGVGAAGS